MPVLIRAKNILLPIFTILFSSLVVFGCSRDSESLPETGVSQGSYTLGYTVGANVKDQFSNGIDTEFFLAGANDAIRGLKSVLTEEQMQDSMFLLAETRRQVIEEVANSNLEREKLFLKDNAIKPGVLTTASGLQYQIIEPAAGKRPGPNDTVVTHYHGTLLDGRVFDSSLGGEPRSFGVGQVIPGWTEALQLMSVGSKWRIFVPSELGYGIRGTRGIEPNSVLIFEIELIEIQSADR